MRAIARGIPICRGSWPGGWGTGRGNTADYSTCLLDAHEPGADGRRQTADGRGRGRLPPPPWAARVSQLDARRSTLDARRSTPRWRSPKGPLRDRSGVITRWGHHPPPVPACAKLASKTSLFLFLLSIVSTRSGAWPLTTTDGRPCTFLLPPSSVCWWGNHEEKIQGQPKGGPSGLPRPVPPVHASEFVRTAHVDEFTPSNSGCGAAGHDATASGIPVPARGTPDCDDRVFFSGPGHAGAVSECDVADCGRV